MRAKKNFASRECAKHLCNLPICIFAKFVVQYIWASLRAKMARSERASFEIQVPKRRNGVFMFKVGETVVYGSVGVMEIVDIREERIGGASHTYYVMKEIGSTSGGSTFVPCDNEKLVASIRHLISREEALALIAEMGDIAEAEWFEDNRKRAELFKNVMMNGDRRELVAMLKAIYESGKRRGAIGKKNYLSDDLVMHKAEKLLYSELSVVLGIPESEIPAFIAEKLEKPQSAKS